MAELFAAARWPLRRRSTVFPARAPAGHARRHLSAKRLILHSLLALPADRPYDDLRLVPR